MTPERSTYWANVKVLGQSGTNEAQQKRRKEEPALEKEEVQMAIEFEAECALSEAFREKINPMKKH
jgi:hypothetical protein